MYKFVRSFKKNTPNEDNEEKLNKDQSNVHNTSSNLSSEYAEKIDQNDTRNHLSSTKPKRRIESFVNSRVSSGVKRSYSHQKKNTTSSEKSDNQSSPNRSTSTSSLNTKLFSQTISKPNASSSLSSLNTSLQSSTETIHKATPINFEPDSDLLDLLFNNIGPKKIKNGNSDRFVAKTPNQNILHNNTQNKQKFIKTIEHRSQVKITNCSQNMVLSENKPSETVKLFKKSRKPKNTVATDEETNSKLSKNFRIIKNSHRRTESKGSFVVVAQEPICAKKAQNNYLEINSTPCKRIRSPSAHEYTSLLNLAQSKSHTNRSLKKITIKPLPRSLSVNYLYHKRQGDLRRYQKNALIKIHLRRAGFTTEDIDDIYMPKQLDRFERKLKQCMDVSDNSEIEEAKMRQERLSRVRNKKLKRDIDKKTSRSRIIINYTTSPAIGTETAMDTNSVCLDEKKSYLEEAKRKLETMKNSNGYYYNLNNKLKSSVTNLIRASQDLARNSEIKSKLLNRNWSLKEVYDIRRNQIRVNILDAINSDSSTQIQNNFTSDDIDNVYMPWMMENYGRKLTIEAMRRKVQSQTNNRTKSPYVSQYYAKANDSGSFGYHDLWLIDRDIRRHLKNASNSNLSDSDVSMTDTETSSDDTRPIVPQKINKPDNSLKNKILKAINKSLLTSEVSGIDLNLLKLNDLVKRAMRRVDKRVLERDLEHDLIRSFSCSHLVDLRKEDIKYMNMRINGINSFTNEDIQDLNNAKMLESFKFKLAMQKECKPRRGFVVSKEHTLDRFDRALVTSMPPVQIKSPNVSTPQAPHYSNTDSLFKQIIQERICEFDQRIASEISSTTKKKDQDEDVSTDNDQDDSIEISSDSDDFNISQNEMNNFDSATISKSKIESAINKSLTLKNPGQLISDFYISNMNFAMRYSIEYIQKIADEMRLRRHLQDSMYFHPEPHSKLLDRRTHRSFSVDRLYAVRKEHLRYSNGAQNNRMSFTTDDIQDIYMPSCLDNYKRKIAVELERRRRHAEQTSFDLDNQMNQNLDLVTQSQPIVLDDLDMFLIKKSNFTIHPANCLEDNVVKINPAVVLIDNKAEKTPSNKFIEQKLIERVQFGYQPVQINIDNMVSRSMQIDESPIRVNYRIEPKNQPIRLKNVEETARFQRAKVSIQKKLSFFENYPLVSNVECVVNDEPIQMDQTEIINQKPERFVDNFELEKSDSSSMTSSVSAESSDSLSNIPLNNFEQSDQNNKMVMDRATVVLVPDDKTSTKSPFTKVDIEQVPILEKSNVNYERQNLDIAQVSFVKPMNMAKESLDIVSRLYSNYYQPEKTEINEANLSVVQDQFKYTEPLIQNPNSVIYNPPNRIEEVKQVRSKFSHPIDIEQPKYVIEEYAKKPLNSQIIYSYENSNSFQIKTDLIERAKIGECQDELVNSKLKCEKTFHAPNTTSEDQLMDLAEQIEMVNVVNTDNLVTIEQLPQFERNRLSVLVPTEVINANEIELEEYELDEFRNEDKSEKNLNMREEVNDIGFANVTEFKQVEQPNIDEISLSDADSLHFETYDLESIQNTERISSEMNQAPKLVENKVLNFPDYKSDLIQNTTDEFYTPVMDTDKVEQVKDVQRLEFCHQPNKMSVFNLARQESIKSLKNQTDNLLTDDKNPEYAILKQEITQVDQKPIAQKPIEFKVPLIEQQAFEYLTPNEHELKEDINQTKLTPKKIELLHKASVEPKPVYLNQAESNVSHEEVESLQDLNENNFDKETIEPKREISYQTQNVHISRPAQALYMGNEKSECLFQNDTIDYEEANKEIEFAVIKNEEQIDSKIEQPESVEVLNSPVISTKIDDFLETVKPIDSIELDFEEQVIIKTKKSDLRQPNDIKVSIKQSYGQSDMEEIYYDENCSELNNNETYIKPVYRENTINFQSVHGFKVDFVEKIGLAKEETSSIKNEETIEFKSNYLQIQQSIQNNFEPNDNMDRSQKIGAQTVLNNPVIGQLKIETVESFINDDVSYHKPSIKVQDKEWLDKNQVNKIQCLSAPSESHLQEDEQVLTKFTNNLNQVEPRITANKMSEFKKVGIQKNLTLNLAAFAESSDNDKLEPIRERENNLEVAQQSLIDQDMNQPTILSLNTFALSREIVELYNASKVEDFTSQLDSDVQCVQAMQQNLLENKLIIDQIKPMNAGNPEQDRFSECEEICVNEIDEFKSTWIRESSFMTSYQRARNMVISMPKEDKFSISSSSLDSLENEMAIESNSNVQYVENLNTINDIQSQKSFNLNRLEELESPIDQVDELNESLNLENSIIKTEINELNQKIDQQHIDLINMPMEKTKSESEYELESLSDSSLIEKQNLGIEKEIVPFFTADKACEKMLKAPVTNIVSLNDSQELDELSLDRESEYQAKFSNDETRIETYEIDNRFQTLNLAKTEQNSLNFEETDSFSLESIDEIYLNPINEIIPVSSQPIHKKAIECLNSAEIKHYEVNDENIENIQSENLDTKFLEPSLVNVSLESPVEQLKSEQVLNVPQNDQAQDLVEFADSFVNEFNFENVPFDLVQNEFTENHSKFSVHYLNAAKLESESCSSYSEAKSLNIEPKSETNLESKIENNHLNNKQLKTKIGFLNAPKTELDELSDFEEVDSLILDSKSEMIAESNIETNDLSFGQTQTKIQSLNAPQLEDEELRSEKVDYFEPELKTEIQLESKIDTELINSKPVLQQEQALNAPKVNDLSLIQSDDADSLNGSEPLVEESLVSQYRIDLTKACLNKKINFLNAPRNQIINIDNDENAENVNFQISVTHGSFIRAQNEANLNASGTSIKILAAPKIDQVNQEPENVENIDIEILNKSRLEINDYESKLDNACRKSVIIFGAGICRNLSHSYIEKAESFESRKEMENVIIKNETNYQSYAYVQEPVRVLMCEIEDSIDDSFNDSINNIDNCKFESVEFKHESNFLNNKPDKKFLLWLNYPKLVQNEEEEVKRIDETFDYLYEQIAADIKSNDSSLQKESNLVHIEKVLSLFISNQEHVEYNEEILRFLPNQRPEVQHLILNQTKSIEFANATNETQEQQIDPKDLSLEEDSIEEFNRQKNSLEVNAITNETRPSSGILFNSNLGQFFNQDENLNQLAGFIQPSQINKLTNQITHDASKSKMSSLEQKLEEIWHLNSEINNDQNTTETDLATNPMMKFSKWNDLMTSSLNNENTLSIHSEDEESFFEKMENFETIETSRNKIHSTLIDENLDFSDNLSINIRTKSNSDNDTDSTSLSESSGQMHLIECVEVLTGPGAQDLLQIQKVDINRLKVKERSKYQTDDPKSRFKVNLKKEEIVDLRHEDKFNVTTKQEFAKKFVEQLINLNASRLGPHLSLNDHGESINRDINCIASKNTNEILNTLSGIKCDLSKHFADSLISEYGPESNLFGEQCLNMNLMEDLSDREDINENFTNRLHSTSNFNEAIRQDNSNESKGDQVVEILAQIVKQRSMSNSTTDSDDSLENLKKNITMDSMQSFLDTVAKKTKETISSKIDELSDDETSIQEIVIFNQKLLNEDDKKLIKPHKYKINRIKANFSEPTNFESDRVDMVNGTSIACMVEANEEIKDFDEAVDIVDSVVIDHTSEDDKSTTSEEVTFERWTEETKLTKTQIYKGGNLVEEIVKQSTPELVGNILKEKIIERHEHIKHISQDVLKRVRIKSPGQSRRQSLDIQEILNEDLDGSNIIIVEPTVTSVRPVSSKDNTYYIQHQQVITPTQSSEPTEIVTTDSASNIKTYYGDLKAVSIDGSGDDVLIVPNDSQLKPSTPNPMKNQEKKDQMIKNQYDRIIHAEYEEQPDLSNESIRNKSDSILSMTTDSCASMQRFERPSKSELIKIHQQKQNQIFFYEDQASTILESEKNTCDKTIDESTLKEIKREDITDLSDEDQDNNIFGNEQIQLEKIRKNLPLRRESFELAQKDLASRHSIARSTTSSSSSSFTTNQIIIKPDDSPAPISNKRLLSEIRPAEATDDLNDRSDDAKATEESDSEILKRNYELLRKKTSEKVLRNDQDHLDNQASFVSVHSIKSEPTKPSVRPTKIKIVKRQKIPARSASPGLMRGPDMIETIQTTTSMSFIMNKTLNLLSEEKREKQTESGSTSDQQSDSVKYTAVPIHVQTRSRSEPKIKPLNEPKEIKVLYRDDKKPKVTFHKYDSNEIIAVVNVPEAMETKTVKSVLDNCESVAKSTPNLTEANNLLSKLDSWKKWPEYTVDQETDTSILSNEYNHCWIKETADSRVVFRNNRVKDKDPEFEIEIEKILPLHDRTKQTTTDRYSTHSILTTNVHSHTDETVATRMSSGYFSGDEFRSQMASYSPSYSTSNLTESPRVSATQFNVNKFLNNPSRFRSKTTNVLDEFNKFYQSLGLNEVLSDKSNEMADQSTSNIQKLIDPETYSDYYYRKAVYSKESNSADNDLNERSRNAKYSLKRDDASILNIERKRSSSMSNLNNDTGNFLILPSPTSADYLRNKTRESALINVVMKPAKTVSDIETSQILYDDMAYRQLRKDTDAFKLSQIKSNRQNLPNNLTNITSLPISYAPGRNSTSDYYQNSNSARTVKMIKQKDASNKTYRQNGKSSIDMAQRYFSNESNPELNDYYDSLNHVKANNKKFGNY